MALIVVCGGGKDVGKTALVCGLVEALREFAWTAVKVSSHEHGRAEMVWEETEAGPGTDTARYLAAGARRALLVSAGDEELQGAVERVMAEAGPRADLIFESNRVLRFVRPELCLAVESATARKSSFVAAAGRMDARVVVAERDECEEGNVPVFRLRTLERISAEMAAWARAKLSAALG